MWSCTYLDPPKSPESKGDFDRNLVPPLLRGARQGGLIVRGKSYDRRGNQVCPVR